jgi:hypothetical protein
LKKESKSEKIPKQAKRKAQKEGVKVEIVTGKDSSSETINPSELLRRGPAKESRKRVSTFAQSSTQNSDELDQNLASQKPFNCEVSECGKSFTSKKS